MAMILAQISQIINTMIDNTEKILLNKIQKDSPKFAQASMAKVQHNFPKKMHNLTLQNNSYSLSSWENIFTQRSSQITDECKKNHLSPKFSSSFSSPFNREELLQGFHRFSQINSPRNNQVRLCSPNTKRGLFSKFDFQQMSKQCKRLSQKLQQHKKMLNKPKKILQRCKTQYQTPAKKKTERRSPAVKQKNVYQEVVKSNYSTIQPIQNKIKLEDFQLIRQIGRGIYGEVSLVRHKKTNTLYALKTIAKYSIDSERMMKQLISEIKLQTFVSHPNSVQLYSFFHDKTNIYLICQYLSDGHLYNYLQKKKKLSETEVKNLTKNICSSLRYLHQNKIIHRDLKPQNIVLQFGIPKLCDYGWSVYSDVRRETCCGTPIYLSPQISRGQTYSYKTDIWAIGIIVFQLIAGKPPFEIDFSEDMLPNTDYEINYPSYISSRAKQFIGNLLERDQNKRPGINQALEYRFLQ